MTLLIFCHEQVIQREPSSDLLPWTLPLTERGPQLTGRGWHEQMDLPLERTKPMPISVGHRHWSSARGSEAQGFQQKHSGHRRRSDFGMAAGRAWMAAAPILFILMGATEAVGNTELNQLLAEVEEFAKTGPGGENNAVEVITFTSDSWTALSEFLSKLAEVADANNYLEYLQKASSVILQCIDKIEASIKEKIPSLEYTEAIHAAVQDLHVTQTDPSTIAEAASALSGWIQAAKKAIKSFPADDEWAKAMGCILLFKKVYQKSLDFTGSLSQVQKNPEAVAGRRMQGEPPPIEIQVPLTGGISTVNGDTRPPNGFDWSRLGFCGASITGPGILYSLEAPGTGSITLSTCGAADFDTKISVYQGVDPDTASCVTGDDEATPEAGCSGFTTDVSFDVVQGQSFLALVHGFGTSTGTFTLTVTSNVVSTPPPAIEIQVPSTVAGDTAANGYPWFSLGGCGPSFTGLGILYSLEAPGTGGITVSTCNNADFDTKISVYQGADPATASCVTGEDDTVGCSGFTTEVSFDAEKGQSFLVLVHGFGASTGTFSLSTTPDLIPIQVPSTVAGDTAANGFPWSSLGFCGTSITAPGILYSLEAPGTGGITVSTCNSASYNTKISVYQGADPATASCVTGLDDTPGCSGLTTKLSFYAVDGQGFLVLVHGSATGTFSLSTAFEATPDPVPIAVPSTVAGDTAANGFPWSSLGFCGTSITAPGILYSLEAPAPAVSRCPHAAPPATIRRFRCIKELTRLQRHVSPAWMTHLVAVAWLQNYLSMQRKARAFWSWCMVVVVRQALSPWGWDLLYGVRKSEGWSTLCLTRGRRMWWAAASNAACFESFQSTKRLWIKGWDPCHPVDHWS